MYVLGTITMGKGTYTASNDILAVPEKGLTTQNE